MQNANTSDNILTSCLEAVENAFGSQLLNLELGQEELKKMVTSLLDTIRQQQADVEKDLSALWRKQYQEIRKKDISVADTERMLATSLVFGCAIVFLSCHSDAFYNYEVASYLREADAQNNVVGNEGRLRTLVDVIEPYEEALACWIEDYMKVTAADDNQTAQNNLQASAFSQYIMLTKEVDIIIKCLHQLVDSQNSPKNQLAPIKAAIEYKPHLINSNLPLEVFNSEFNLDIAKSTYGNWIRGHHGSTYREDELKVYWDIFKHEITPQNVKSAL